MTTRVLSAGMLAALLVIPAAAVAQEPATHRVDPNGSADFVTISAAVEAAADGDSIVVAPGTYVENLHLDKALTLSGDGPREEIVILHDESDYQYVDMEPDGTSVVTVYVDDVDVTIERISVMDEHDLYTSILLDGGTSTIRDVYTNDFVGVRGDAVATIEDSYIERLGSWGAANYTVATGNEIRDFFFGSEGARGRLEGNTVFERPFVIESGASFEIVDNTFYPNEVEPGIIVVGPESTATVTGNEVNGGFAGVILEFSGESLVEGNVIRDGEVGVVALETPSIIRDNTVLDSSENGIVVGGNGVTVTGNELRGGRIGILVHDSGGFPPDIPLLQAPPSITANAVEATHFAVVIADMAPTLRDNELCAGREAIRITGESSPTIGTNPICEVPT